MRKLLLIAFLSYGSIGFSQLSTQEKIHEVYGTEFFVDKEDGFDFWVNVLENRISFSEESISSNEKYEKISEAGLANKLNPEIPVYNSEEFNVETFNPLRYQLDFYQSTLTKIYRIDGTNYLLIIQPQ